MIQPQLSTALDHNGSPHRITPATAAQAQPAVAISAEVSLRSAAVQEVAAVLPSPAAVVLFCVSTGLHLAPVTLLKGAICMNKHTN